MDLPKQKLFVYLRPVLRVSLQQNEITKRFRKCPDKREHISHPKGREEINMVLGNAWQPRTDERFWQGEGPREERS